jgi:hypothetical protein
VEGLVYLMHAGCKRDGRFLNNKSATKGSKSVGIDELINDDSKGTSSKTDRYMSNVNATVGLKTPTTTRSGELIAVSMINTSSSLNELDVEDVI